LSLVAQATNAAAAAPQVVQSDHVDFGALELLPPSARRALMQATYPMASFDVLVRYHALRRALGADGAERRLLHEIAECELAEIEDFAEDAGYSAHLAAGATILRYGAE
jgi:hypothetical protein